MISFKKYLKEAFNKRVDIPYDNKTNAPTRYNNPGGAYPAQKFEKLGLKGYGIIGGGHKIGYYGSVPEGVSANVYHLRSMPVVGKTVAEMRHYWVNGNFSGRKSLPGMNDNQVITNELLQDHNWLAAWMIATARAEGFQGTLDKNVFDSAFSKLDGKSNYDPSKVPPLMGSPNDQLPQQQSQAPTDYASPGEAAKGLMQGIEMLKKGMNFGMDSDSVLNKVGMGGGIK